MPKEPGDALRRLLSVMARLRDPEGGCPWDLAQDFSTIAPYTIEEAYEVSAVISEGPDPARLEDELGDLLLQVVYHSRLAEERCWFSFGDVAAAIAEKMIRRHPHVFAPGPPPHDAAVDTAWEAAKAAERAKRAETGALAGIAPGLPALAVAAKLTARAARVGFDWPDTSAVLDKLEEEASELRAELEAADRDRLADEVGDLLFVLANLARKLGLDAETCLHQANSKFHRRFTAVEARLATGGLTPADATLEQMESAWIEIKGKET